MPWTSRPLLWCLGMLLAARLAVIAWGVGRGLELGDEGFFLLNLRDPAQAPPLFAFYALASWLDALRHVDVVSIRWLRIACELAGSLALIAAAAAWARRRLLPEAPPAGSALLATAGLGLFVTTASRAFGYNDLTNLCTFGATSLLLWLDAQPEGAPRSRLRWLAFAAGLALGGQLLVKFPPAILLLVVFAGLLALASGPTRADRPALLASLGAGFVVMPLVFALGAGVEGLSARLELVGVTNRLIGYGIGEILLRYLVADVDAWAQLAVWILVIGGLERGLRGRLEPGPDVRDRALALALGITAAVMAGAASVWHPFWLDGSVLHLFCGALVMVLGFGLLATHVRHEAGAPLRPLVPVALLALLPFALILGTNVPLSLRAPTHLLPLALALVLLLADLAHRGLRRSALAGLLVLAASTTWVFVEHQLRSPYGLPAGLLAQSQALEGAPGIRVDPESRAFLEAVRREFEAAGFQPGDPVVAFDYMPGLVTYLGARSPVFPFYPPDRPLLNCFNLNRAAAPLRPFLVLGRPMHEGQRSCIDAFDFPRDFRLLARLPNPYAGVYARFFGAPGLEEVSLYAPRVPPVRATSPDASDSSTAERSGGRKAP